MTKLSDTIAAVATGMNQGGIGIIRVSGNHAIEITDSIFIPNKKGKEIRNLSSYTAAYGNVIEKKDCKKVMKKKESLMKSLFW